MLQAGVVEALERISKHKVSCLAVVVGRCYDCVFLGLQLC
jgi:hypothetical protein